MVVMGLGGLGAVVVQIDARCLTFLTRGVRDVREIARQIRARALN